MYGSYPYAAAISNLGDMAAASDSVDSSASSTCNLDPTQFRQDAGTLAVRGVIGSVLQSIKYLPTTAMVPLLVLVQKKTRLRCHGVEVAGEHNKLYIFNGYLSI